MRKWVVSLISLFLVAWATSASSGKLAEADASTSSSWTKTQAQSSPFSVSCEAVGTPAPFKKLEAPWRSFSSGQGDGAKVAYCVSQVTRMPH